MNSSRRKVVLYNPRAVFYTMPLALLAIGSHLDPERFEVIIVDGRLDPDAENTVANLLEDAVCLGVTVLTGAPIADALNVSRAAKAAAPNVPIVWGGWHPSMFGQNCLEEPCVDVVVEAQGEATFAEIVERFAGGESLEGCAGCAYKTADGTVHSNSPRALLPLDVFRPHNYELIPVESYFDLKGKRQLDYISSQGCNFRCAFCSDPFVYGRKWVGIDPSVMVQHLTSLREQYGFEDVNFQDETFFTQRKRIKAFAEGLVNARAGFSWAATMRADQGVRMPDDLWQICKESGLRRLLVGVESGDNAMLKKIKKDIKIEQVYDTAERMRKLGIAGQFPFIVGFPKETDESIEATLECAKKLRSMSDNFETPIFYFKPYPGSAIVAEAVAEGYQLPGSLADWSEFDFVAGLPGPWVSDEKYELIERFKFFLDLASKPSRTWGTGWLSKLAEVRCSYRNFRWPIEMRVASLFTSPEKLS